MRILSVWFKNLNSLTGEWRIDFTHPAYASDGIFAITGPTGAGKTTILDAICLALYGRTPRLKKITESDNEIMSRQTGECFAEVTFTTRTGSFRCHFSQHRGRKRPDGKLQPPRHEISDAVSGQVLEAKQRDAAKRIEEVTGMDFDRFTRSMLLAQGGFAVFLQAPPDERAPILEQITGTGIYSRISMQVHKRRSEERDRLEQLQTELGGLQLLSSEEEVELRASLSQSRGRESVLSGQLETIRIALAWHDKLAELSRDCAAIEVLWHDFAGRWQTFQPELQRLAKALNALTLEGEFVKVTALRNQQDKEMQELGDAGHNLPDLVAAKEELLAARNVATAKLAERQLLQNHEANTIKLVRELDTRIAVKIDQLAVSQKTITTWANQHDIIAGHLKSGQEALKRAAAQLLDIEHYLNGHAVDAGLATDLSAITKMFEVLHDKETDYREAGEALARAATAKDAAVAGSEKQKTTLEKNRAEILLAEEAQRQLIEEIRLLLNGRVPAEWRVDLEERRERKRLLEQAGELLDRLAAANQALAGLQTDRESLAIAQATLLAELSTGAGRKEAAERQVGYLETQVGLLNRIRALADERLRLQDGTPCPLCGSIEHPYAAGNIPEPDEGAAVLAHAKIELTNAADRLIALQVKQAEITKDIQQTERELDIQKTALASAGGQCAELLGRVKINAPAIELPARVGAELVAVKAKIADLAGVIDQFEQKTKQEEANRQAFEKTKELFSKSEKAMQECAHREEITAGEHKRLSEACADLAKQVAYASAEALQAVARFGVAEIPVAQRPAVLQALKAKRDRWRIKEDQKVLLEKEIAAITAEIAKQQALLANQEGELEAKRQAQTVLTEEVTALKKNRQALYGKKNPDDEEKCLAAAVADAENNLTLARENYGRLEQAIAGLEAMIKTLKSSTGQRTPEIVKAEHELRGRLQQNGFADETGFRAACLAIDERNILSRQADALQKEQTELLTRKSTKARELQAEQGKKITEESYDVLQQEIKACTGAIQETQQEIGASNQRLTENESRRAGQQEKRAKIATQKIECDRWETLHGLIGSADGKKYRNFAQGLTFEIMVRHANRKLRQMTDRYLLVRDNAQPLEINVIDSYQAGEIRSTKNLSGGECFVVSLALALGLAHMASRNVRIDSLFLDEGFGTLDEDALETALETLAGLQQEGKLIGVISHVPALKERISAQIQVTPQTGGRSSLSGPGCRTGAEKN